MSVDLLDPRTPSSRRFGRTATRASTQPSNYSGSRCLRIRAGLHTHHDVSGPKSSKGCAARSQFAQCADRRPR
eukprot:5965889-Prymnesium_polylepis.1